MKQKAKNISPWKLGALAGLCASLIIVLACSEDRNEKALSDKSQMQSEVFTIVEQQP